MASSAGPSPSTLDQQRAEAEKKYGPKLPSAVTQAAAAVDALYTQPPPPAQPDGAPPSSPAPGPQDPAGQPAAPTLPAAEPTPEQPVNWEQRALSAEGRVNALLQRESETTNRLEQLQRTVSEMQARGGQPYQESQPAQPFERPTLITDEEYNDYGKDLIGVTKKAAREELAPEFETLAQRIQRLEGRVDGASQAISRNEVQSTWSYLARHVPNWNEINHHPDFKERYLGTRDPASGRLRRDLIKEAFDTHDSGRVLHFFQGYLSEANGTPPQPQPSPQPQPQGQPGGNGADPLLAFAAPGRARSEPQSPLPPGKPTYTRAQMQKFWDDRRRGRWTGREADADAIENDIFRAQHEGRIVG